MHAMVLERIGERLKPMKLTVPTGWCRGTAYQGSGMRHLSHRPAHYRRRIERTEAPIDPGASDHWNGGDHSAVTKNPLGRIMDVFNEKDSVTITNTDVKLAQKIGRNIFISHGGQLQYIWSYAEAPVRITWFR